jgi:hypothetical protein
MTADHSGNFVTVITVNSRVNKKFELLADGTLQKEAVATIKEGVAQSHFVPDAQSMSALLTEISESENMVIVAGRFKGDNGSPFAVVTADRLAAMLGVSRENVPSGITTHNGKRVAARLAAGIEPSGWILLDADTPPGMPAVWAEMSLSERLRAWEVLLPGLSSTGKLSPAFIC